MTSGGFDAPAPALAAATVPKLHIVFLVRALGFGGTERQTVHLAHGLAGRGHRVTVVTFYPGDGFDRAFSGTNPALCVLGKRGRWDVPGFLWRLSHRLAALRPDVIYGLLPVPNLLAAALRPLCCRGAAVVWGVRGTPLELGHYDRLQQMSIRLERTASAAADLVVANSRAGAQAALTAGFPADRVATVCNGIDTAAFRPASADERRAARTRLNVAADAIAIAVVARLEPMKGHAVFFAALAQAAQSEPRLCAVIAGAGEPAFRRRLADGAAALGVAERIVWRDAGRDIATVYHAADMLCLPSIFGEGFPNVVGEAMAAGLPCIVTAVGDGPVVVGATGRVVPPGDAGTLAAAILDYAGLARQCTGRTAHSDARLRITENFGIETMIAKTETLLLQAAQRRRSSIG